MRPLGMCYDLEYLGLCMSTIYLNFYPNIFFLYKHMFPPEIDLEIHSPYAIQDANKVI